MWHTQQMGGEARAQETGGRTSGLSRGGRAGDIRPQDDVVTRGVTSQGDLTPKAENGCL